jgi:aconitate hydratase
MDIDLDNEPIGHGSDGEPVFLADIWPTPDEIRDTVAASLEPEMFTRRYATVGTGDENWQALPLPEESSLYEWSDQSTYVRRPPFFEGMTLDVPDPEDVSGARVLAILGQSVTTDHISPAGAIPKAEPAGVYLRGRGVEVRDFNTFGARRGNHEVMMRGTFGNVRIRNLLLDGREGGYTVYFPTGEEMPIYDASMRYQADGTPLVILAGREYGTGSSRDWAAKGTGLLGVRAVIAESFERIHRSNLVGMGVLPLEFVDGETPSTLGLTGRETFDLTGISEGLEPGCHVDVKATAEGGGRLRRRLPRQGPSRFRGRRRVLPQRRHPPNGASEDGTRRDVVGWRGPPTRTQSRIATGWPSTSLRITAWRNADRSRLRSCARTAAASALSFSAKGSNPSSRDGARLDGSVP